MAKFKKKKSNGDVSMNTSALPDIVFMLLFFFMVSTKMKDKEMKVKTVVPKASEIEKLVKKSWVNYIYVGPPTDVTKGSAARIQLNDAFANVADVQEYITLERNKSPEAIRDYLTTSIKADRTVKMGMIQDIKQELRQVNALKLNYSASKALRENQD
jgi:biopolymer transport protein ExbD